MNPLSQRSGPKIAPATDMEVAATPEIAAQQGGGGMSGMVGRALAAAKEKQAAVANTAVRPQAPPNAPVAKSIEARSRRARAGLSQVGASQAELAGEAQPMSRRPSLSDRMARAQGTLDEQVAEAEVGGTRTETPVIEPSLNEARRNRSRSGRIYR